MAEPSNPGPTPAALEATPSRPPLEDPRALQILIAEHSSLVASRSLD